MNIKQREMMIDLTSAIRRNEGLFWEKMLKPNTEPDKLKEMLETEVPEVICDKHISKYPEIYTSMKVTIRQENLSKAWRNKKDDIPKSNASSKLGNETIEERTILEAENPLNLHAE
ncbi:hypothetical protein JTB14_005065 [Gonioctena quinquepunctata]|nr:hypothetical protein JTB14_005065 [Gonioctena quinquepunctata]